MVALAGAAMLPRLAMPTTETVDRLVAAEDLKIRNHPRFLELLAQIHRDSSALSAAQRWHLRYLDAWETSYRGDYEKARPQLATIASQSGDVVLAAKASALLMNNESINGRYGEAFTLANQLAAQLPALDDKSARLSVLMNLSQMLNSAGQTDLAIRYARMMRDALPPGDAACYPYVMETGALYNAKALTASSRLLDKAIRACAAANQPVVSNTQILLKAVLLIEEKHAAQALVLLDRIAPSVQRSRYFAHSLYLLVERAQAYELLGRDKDAEKAAREAIRIGKTSGMAEVLRNAYAVLYRLEKKRRNMGAALDYYEGYVAQDRKYLDDVTARALAYQTVQQQTLTRKLEAEELSKQNSVLRLQQALDAKAAETSRLYIALLAAMLVFIVAWLIRLKRSQLRFKRLSFHDGLTGIYNHQHFVTEAERVLRGLEKSRQPAGLVFIDLDHFKQINDTHGHAIGDEVLRHTVAVCQSHLRSDAVFGRLGGEEFGVLLPHCTRTEALDIAGRLLEAIRTTPLTRESQLVRVSASVGVAFTDAAGYDLQRLCKDADDALYRAKRAGRNRIVADWCEDDRVLEA